MNRRAFASLAGTLFLVCALFVPISAQAAMLTGDQVNAVLGLLRAFGASDSSVAAVAAALSGQGSTGAAATATTTVATRPSTDGSPYLSSTLGYDISYSSRNYPQMPFGFAVIGATAGKSFTRNTRLAAEFSWARLAAATAPTIYLNVNAPYGSSATTAHLSSPQTCTALFDGTTTSASAGGTFPEPTTCAAYNYGYNAAQDAYAFTASQANVASKLWWLDVEEENSWSPNTAVNDAVIQGAIDALNARGIRVGIYSMAYMWKNIAGAGFTPTQSLSGAATPIATWFPIGIATQVGATNACLTKDSFIPGSPVWVIQYVLDSKAVDQNVAC